MLAALHCIHCYVGMACPVGAYVYKVDIILPAKTSPPFAVAVADGCLAALCGDDAFCIIDVLLDKVAQGCYAATVNVHHAMHGTFGTYAKAYEAYTHALYRLALQLQYVPSLTVVVSVVHHVHLLCKITKKESPFKGFQMN